MDRFSSFNNLLYGIRFADLASFNSLRGSRKLDSLRGSSIRRAYPARSAAFGDFAALRFTSWIFDSSVNITLGVNCGVDGSFHAGEKRKG
jgi:hypothetical protein